MKNPNKLQLDFGFDIKPISKEIAKPKSTKIDFVFEIMDCLTAPIIVFPSAWQTAIPKDVLNNVTMSRLLCQLAGEQMASIPEVVAYMMPRSFESPMPYEWVNIYTWVGLQYARQFKETQQVKDMEEIAPKALSDYDMGLLNGLRKWIYEKRRKALKESMKNIKNTKKEVSPTEYQVNLFGD